MALGQPGAHDPIATCSWSGLPATFRDSATVTIKSTVQSLERWEACTLEKGRAKGHGVHGTVSDQGWDRTADILGVPERESSVPVSLSPWPFSDTLSLSLSSDKSLPFSEPQSFHL